MTRTRTSMTAPFGDAFVPPRASGRPGRAVILPAFSRRAHLRRQVPQSHQVEAGTGEGEDRSHLLFPSVAELAQTAHGLHPTEGLLHDLAPASAYPVAVPAGGAPVDRVVPLLLGHVGGDGKRAGFLDEVSRVVAPVGPHGHPAPVPRALPGEEIKTGRNLDGAA